MRRPVSGCGATPKPDWTWWQPVGRELVTQWRTTPFAVDLNRDGLMDLVMEDLQTDNAEPIYPPLHVFTGLMGRRVVPSPVTAAGRLDLEDMAAFFKLLPHQAGKVKLRHANLLPH